MRYLVTGSVELAGSTELKMREGFTLYVRLVSIQMIAEGRRVNKLMNLPKKEVYREKNGGQRILLWKIFQLGEINKQVDMMALSYSLKVFFKIHVY